MKFDGEMKRDYFSPAVRARKGSLQSGTPTVLDYIHAACKDFIEVRGDRLGSDDRRIICGYGAIFGQSVALLAYDQTGAENGPNGVGLAGLTVNGYRKAFRVMQLAEKFGHPLLVLTVAPALPTSIAVNNTPCEALVFARHVQAIWQLKVPTVLIILGRQGFEDLFSIWAADRIVASEQGAFAMTVLDQQLVPRRVFVKTETLISHKIIDVMVPDMVNGADKLSPVMARGIRHSIGLALSEVRFLPHDQLMRERAARAARFIALKRSCV